MSETTEQPSPENEVETIVLHDLPDELAWLDYLQLQFVVEPVTDENGMRTAFSVRVTATTPRFREVLNGAHAISSAEFTFAQSKGEMVAQLVMGMTTRVYDTFRGAWMQRQKVDTTKASSLIIPG